MVPGRARRCCGKGLPPCSRRSRPASGERAKWVTSFSQSTFPSHLHPRRRRLRSRPCVGVVVVGGDHRVYRVAVESIFGEKTGPPIGPGVYKKSDFRVSAVSVPLHIAQPTGRAIIDSGSTVAVGLDLSFLYTPDSASPCRGATDGSGMEAVDVMDLASLR
jgi:hypothetical protein